MGFGEEGRSLFLLIFVTSDTLYNLLFYYVIFLNVFFIIPHILKRLCDSEQLRTTCLNYPATVLVANGVPGLPGLVVAHQAPLGSVTHLER